jgi:hypothetical protein
LDHRIRKHGNRKNTKKNNEICIQNGGTYEEQSFGWKIEKA